METESFRLGLGFAAAFVSLVVALKLWRLAIVQWAREEGFALRADLFDSAAAKNAFDDPAYQRMRLVINGFLRWTEHVNGISVAFLLVRLVFFGYRPRLEIEGIEGSPMKADIEAAQLRLNRIILNHVRFGSVSGVFLVLMLRASGRLNAFIRFAFEHSKRMGDDDQFAKSERRWWNDDDCAPPRLAIH